MIRRRIVKFGAALTFAKKCLGNEFPCPSIGLLVDAIVGQTMFCFMDGFNSYNQIKMHPHNTERTAFKTPVNNFHYTVKSLGLKNAGSIINKA